MSATVAIAAGASRERQSTGMRETMTAGQGESTANATSAEAKTSRLPATI